MLLGEKNIRTHLNNAEWKKLMKNRARIYIGVAFVVISMVCISNAQAVLDTQTYGFNNITNNNAANAALGELQLTVVVSEYLEADSKIGFQFINAGPADCVITEIYFQDGFGSMDGFVEIDESLEVNNEPVVDFKQEDVGNVNPKNLPGGKSINPEFIATAAFSIEPVNPEPTWGVAPEEWVKIVYSLKPGKTYANIIEELENADLRIGIHVQSYADGGSESFITPEPASMALLALGGLILRKRREV